MSDADYHKHMDTRAGEQGPIKIRCGMPHRVREPRDPLADYRENQRLAAEAHRFRDLRERLILWLEDATKPESDLGDHLETGMDFLNELYRMRMEDPDE